MSIEAMKQAVATFEKIVDGCNGIDEGQDVHSEAKKVARLVIKDCLPALKALRQALAQPEQEPLGGEWVPCVKLPVIVHVRNQRDGENHISTREGITPVLPDDLIMRGVAGEEYPIGRELFERTYTFDVDAVNMSQDHVDETAKGEHEPVAWYGIDDYGKKYLGWDKHDLHDEGFAWTVPLYTAPPKKKWVGLSDEEKYDVLEGATGDGGRVYYDTLFRTIQAKLKEKNT